MSVAVPTTDASPIETFQGLKAWVLEVLDRDDLDAVIDKMVRMAEYHLRRQILSIQRETTATLSATGETVLLPTDFVALRNAYLATDPPVQLSQLAPTVLKSRYPATGQPLGYAIGNGVLILGPAPDGPYNVQIRYIQNLPYLSDTNPTNWLLSSHADVYVYATLLQADAYIQDDPRLGIWKSALEEAIANINEQGNRYRHSGTPLRLSSPVVV